MTRTNPDDPWGEVKAPYTITSDRVTDGYPYGRPASGNGSDNSTSNGTTNTPKSKESLWRLKATRMATVEREHVRHLWQDRFFLGKVAVIAGMQGLGKSMVTIDMAARISTGTSWPDTPNDPNPTGSVILLSAEDGLGDTIRPRLEAAGPT